MLERWQAAPGEQLELRQWDGETVVFVTSTGDTHALSPAASLVLATMLDDAEAARPADEWLRVAAADGNVSQDGVDDAERLAFEQLLLGLEAIGAVRRRAP